MKKLRKFLSVLLCLSLLLSLAPAVGATVNSSPLAASAVLTTGKYVLKSATQNHYPTELDGSWVLVGTEILEDNAWTITVNQDGTVKLQDKNNKYLAPKYDKNGNVTNGISNAEYNWIVLRDGDKFRFVSTDFNESTSPKAGVILSTNETSSGKVRAYKAATAIGSNSNNYDSSWLLYPVTSSDPASCTEHSYTAWDKNETGHWAKCANCGHVEDSTPISHAGTEIGNDKTQHWTVCATCGWKFDLEPHADANSDYLCDTEGCTGVVPPAADSTLTIPQANALGLAMSNDTYTEGKYKVTGIVESIKNTTYGNMYIQDADGNKLYIYGTYSADGSTRYDKMVTKPVKGDTVTIYGIVGQFNGTAQIKNGWVTIDARHTCADVSDDGNHKCDACGVTLCSDAPNDGNHKCDECGKDDVTICDDAPNDGNHKCDECGKDDVTTCDDASGDGDHKCDECGADNATAHIDSDNNYKCDECGADLCTNHTPGDPATCTTAQTCTNCGAQIVPAKGHDWADATCTAPKTCKVCGATEGEALAHKDENKDHKCDVCQVKTSDHALKKVEAKEATQESEGNKEHWVCETCGKLFADSEGKTETTKAEVTLPKLPASSSPVYTKVDPTKVTEGSYIILGLSATAMGDVNTAFMTTENATATRLMGAALTITNGTVTTADTYVVWNLIATEGGFYVQNAKTGEYLYYDQEAGGNKIYMTADKATAGVWKVVSHIYSSEGSENDGNTYYTLEEVASGRQLSANRFGKEGSYYMGFAAYANTSSTLRALEFFKLTSSNPGTGSGDNTNPGTGSGDNTNPGTGSGDNNNPGTGSGDNTSKDVISISNSLAGEKGTVYTVKGVVTLLDGQNVYIQDSTGAVCIRLSSKDHGIKMGDTIIATGKLDNYNGLPQLASASFEKSDGLHLYASKKAIDTLTAADVGKYINLNGVKIVEIYDNDGQYANPNITVEDANGNKIQIYKAVLGKKADGSWAFKVGDIVNINAAVSIYKDTLQLRNTYASEIVDSASVPATGDASLISVFVALMAVSGLGLTAVVAKKKEF